MTDEIYTGYRFEWERPDVKGTVRRASCLAIARSEDEAYTIMIASVSGTRMGLRFIGKGDAVLSDARKHGIGDGEGREVGVLN